MPGIPQCFVDELPDELLLVVITHLQVRRDFVPKESARRLENTHNVRALHALTLTCRRLSALATPRLYENVIQCPNRLWVLALRLRTLKEKPESARYIKYIEVDGPNTSSPLISRYYSHDSLESFSHCLTGAGWSIPSADMLGMRHLVSVWDPFEVPSEETFFEESSYEMRFEREVSRDIQRLRKPIFYALAIVILLADNLTAIASEDHTLVLIAILFRNPTRCKMRGLSMRMGARGAPLFAVKAKPGDPDSLRKFVCQAYDFDPFCEACGFPTDPLGFPAVGEIEIEIYNLSLISVQKLFKSCRDLRRLNCHFIYGNFRGQREIYDYPGVDFSCLALLLTKIWNPLTVLELDTTGLGNRDCNNRDNYVRSIGSLRHLTALQHLTIAETILWGDDAPKLSDVLPPCLLSLRIQLEWHECFCHLNLDEKEFEAALPQLKRLEFWWPFAPQNIVNAVINSCAMRKYTPRGTEVVMDFTKP